MEHNHSLYPNEVGLQLGALFVTPVLFALNKQQGSTGRLPCCLQPRALVPGAARNWTLSAAGPHCARPNYAREGDLRSSKGLVHEKYITCCYRFLARNAAFCAWAAEPVLRARAGGSRSGELAYELTGQRCLCFRVWSSPGRYGPLEAASGILRQSSRLVSS